MPSTRTSPIHADAPSAGDLLVCDEVSVEHLDGTTSCVDPDCEVPHGLHRFVAGCADLEAPCVCAPADAVPMAA